MKGYVLRCRDINDHTLKYEVEDTDEPLKSKFYLWWNCNFDLDKGFIHWFSFRKFIPAILIFLCAFLQLFLFTVFPLKMYLFVDNVEVKVCDAIIANNPSFFFFFSGKYRVCFSSTFYRCFVFIKRRETLKVGKFFFISEFRRAGIVLLFAGAVFKTIEFIFQV